MVLDASMFTPERIAALANGLALFGGLTAQTPGAQQAATVAQGITQGSLKQTQFNQAVGPQPAAQTAPTQQPQQAQAAPQPQQSQLAGRQPAPASAQAAPGLPMQPAPISGAIASQLQNPNALSFPFPPGVASGPAIPVAWGLTADEVAQNQQAILAARGQQMEGARLQESQRQFNAQLPLEERRTKVAERSQEFEESNALAQREFLAEQARLDDQRAQARDKLQADLQRETNKLDALLRYQNSINLINAEEEVLRQRDIESPIGMLRRNAAGKYELVSEPFSTGKSAGGQFTSSDARLLANNIAAKYKPEATAAMMQKMTDAKRKLVNLTDLFKTGDALTGKYLDPYAMMEHLSPQSQMNLQAELEAAEILGTEGMPPARAVGAVRRAGQQATTQEQQPAATTETQTQQQAPVSQAAPNEELLKKYSAGKVSTSKSSKIPERMQKLLQKQTEAAQAKMDKISVDVEGYQFTSRNKLKDFVREAYPQASEEQQEEIVKQLIRANTIRPTQTSLGSQEY